MRPNLKAKRAFKGQAWQYCSAGDKKMNNDEIVAAFAAGKTKGSAGHMFIEEDALYSYGYHFPLAVRLKGGRYLLNGDKRSVTTSCHQSICRQQLEPKTIVSFTALHNIGIGSWRFLQAQDIADFEILEATEDHYRTVQYKDKDGEIKEREQHLLGSVLFKYKKKYYLSSTDTDAKTWGRGYFLVELPKAVKTVSEAYEVLKPKEIKGLDESEYKRQGEFFFLPTDQKCQGNSDIKDLSRLFGNGGNSHIVTRVHKQGKRICVNGTVRHPEHKMVSFGSVWHRVFINTARNSWSVSGVD